MSEELRPAAAPEDNAADDADSADVQPKRRKKKGWLIFGVIVVAVAAIGVGFFAWHNTPGFCNAFCHQSMDTYVNSYYSDNAAYGITVHADNGKSCLDCHEAKITDQVSELMAEWAGNYTTDENGYITPGYEFASEEFCGRCHDMSAVVASTWGFEENGEQYNPHSSHQDLALQCGDCHKIHDKSVLVCNDCHALNVPDGWEG